MYARTTMNIIWLNPLIVFLNLLHFFIPDGVCLKLERIHVPPYVFRGQGAELFCDYDLESDILYSVTWYKDNEEFYRFIPRSVEKQYTYKADGIIVDTSNSDSKKVFIRNVPLIARGIYKCEVSAEAPAFSSVHGETRMEVIVLPRDKPHISSDKGRIYKVGEIVSLNCTSGKSFPASNLLWFVNEKQVKPSSFDTYNDTQGLVRSISSLNLRANETHFINGRMLVTCKTKMFSDFSSSYNTHQQHRKVPLESSIYVLGDASNFKKHTIENAVLLSILVIYSTIRAYSM